MESAQLWSLLAPRLRAFINSAEAVDFVAEFCGVTNKSVLDWLNDKHKPTGDAMIRLWYLLRACGVESPEIDKINPFTRLLAELFAFDVVSPQVAKEVAGQKSTHLGQLYVTLRGRPVMHPSLTVEELDEVYGNDLKQKRDAARHALLPDLAGDSPPDTQAPIPILRPTPESRPAHRAKDLAVTYGPDPYLTLASLLSAAAPLAKRLNESESAEQRSKFRDLIGTELLFNLSNDVNNLCSERARGLAR